jgi:hypothetical protein
MVPLGFSRVSKQETELNSSSKGLNLAGMDRLVVRNHGDVRFKLWVLLHVFYKYCGEVFNLVIPVPRMLLPQSFRFNLAYYDV